MANKANGFHGTKKWFVIGEKGIQVPMRGKWKQGELHFVRLKHVGLTKE